MTIKNKQLVLSPVIRHSREEQAVDLNGEISKL